MITYIDLNTIPKEKRFLQICGSDFAVSFSKSLKSFEVDVE